MVCCRELAPGDSPFTRVVVYAWHDGPARGLMACGDCGRAWRFDMVLELARPDQPDLRVLRLAGAPEGAIDAVSAAMDPWEGPMWPVWTPLVRDAIREAVAETLEGIVAAAGPAEHVMAMEGWRGILAVKKAPERDPKDWLEYVGL